MSTKVTPLGLRLFLEGVEVPVISAQVNAQPDRPSVASIQIVPTDMALHLLPRTLVHLFFLDSDPLEHPAPSPRLAADGAIEANQNRFDAPDAQYKLMFVGEVTGFNYGKNPSSRQIVLQCMDLSTYWDSCYQWFADYSVGGGGLTDKSQNFIGAGTSLFNSVSGGHKWVIGQILNSKPETQAYKNAKGLLGGVIHLLESIGGIGGKLGFNGVNDFFTIAELRYNLLGMLGAIESDTTSASIYNEKAFNAWLKNGMTSMGTLTSFRDIINHVNRYIYHHIYPNPCAFYKPGADQMAEVEVPTTAVRDTFEGRVVLADVRVAHTALLKANVNVVTDSIVISPTVLQIPQTFAFLKKAETHINRAKDGMDAIKADNKSDVLVSIGEVVVIMEDVMRTFGDLGVNDEFLEVEEYLPGFTDDTKHVIKDIPTIAKNLKDFIVRAYLIIQRDILGPRKFATKPATKKVQGTVGARLFNQLFLPECYFVAPPRCNVIFPDQYFQFSFSRNFMREVSRLSMGSGLGMVAGGGRQGAKLFTRNYYAPSIEDTRGKHVFTTTSRGARILLPHEVHSGIIPKYEWANDGHRWAHLAKKAGRDPFFEDGKVGFLQRMANFQFYLHRWSARTMSVSGVFNPYLVLGFPALVMDRSLPNPDTVAAREALLGRRWMPIQYLGKIVGLSHSINQSGGQTSVQFSHCRTHRGLDDEFLSVLSKEVQEIQTTQETVIIDTRQLVNHFLFNNVKFIFDPEDRRSLLKKYMNGRLSVGKPISDTKAYRGFKVTGIVPSDGVTTLGREEAQALELDPNATAVLQRTRLKEDFVGAGTGILDTGASSEPVLIEEVFEEEVLVLKIPEKLTVHMEKKVKVGEPKERNESIEQMLTPGWYADIWTNKKISEAVYRPLIGTDSITENLSLETEKQNEFFNRTLKDEASVQQAELEGVEGDERVSSFGFTETSEVPGSVASLKVVPGSVEEAVDALTILYSIVRLRGGDIHNFIREYTKREIANVEDMLGSYGLEFGDDGSIVIPEDEDTPIEGFHSRAYGDYNASVKLPSIGGAKSQAGENALKALFPGVATGTTVTRGRVTNKKDETAIRPELDPRGRARTRVLAYVQELEFSRGLMG